MRKVRLGRVGRAAVWSAANSIVLRFAQFGVGIVIARVVAPRDFGVFAVALTVQTIIFTLSEMGVSSVLVRDVYRGAEIGRTVATLTLASASVLTVAMVLSAHALASTLGAASATNAIRVISLTVLLNGIGAVPVAVLTRDFRQERQFIADLSGFVVGSAAILSLSLLGWGVMALAWSRIAGQLAATVAVVIMTPERYWPTWRLTRVRELLGFGLPLASANLLGYATGNVDYICIGRIRGPLSLGYYTLAYNISGWPVTILSAVVNGVALPGFARLRDDPKNLASRFCVVLSALVSLAFPVSALCFALSGHLVEAIYGARWTPAVGALSVLALFGAIRIPLDLIANFLVAVGSTKWLMYLQGIWFAALVPTMILLVRDGGSTGAAIAHLSVVSLVVLPTYIVALRRAVPVSVMSLGRAVAIPAIASVVAALIARLVADQLVGDWPSLFLGTLAGLAGFAAIMAPWVMRNIAGWRALMPAASSTETTLPLVEIIG